MDGYWSDYLHAWDVAAGALIAAESGAIITDSQGNPDYLQTVCSVLAANPSLHPVILAELNRNGNV
jgi:myo-inositol-1(or 4)-monophosphatase